MSEVRERLAELAKTDDERNMLKDEDLKTRILQNLNRTNQERIREVKYIVTLFDDQNRLLKRQPFDITESDLLFGTK